MGVITKNSKIETFRRRRHGIDSKLRFLTDVNNDAGGYEQLFLVDSHFYVTRSYDSQQGAYRTRLALNKPAAVTPADIHKAIFIDLILYFSDDVNRQILRYRISTEAPPTTVEDRWYFELTGIFSDETPVAEPAP